MASKPSSLRFLATAFIAGTLLHVEAWATSCSGHSGADRSVLVELFTSEGCDSCPPADRWLSRLREEAPVRRLVPLAFHVDYWDYLGWRDPYAHPTYGQRQRESAARNGLRTIYTPQVVVSGRDMPDWRNAGAFSEVAGKAGRAPARAVISVSWQIAGGMAEVDLSAGLVDAAERKEAVAYIALYENRLTSRVQAGENRGATLEHDFVVRGLIGPLAFADDGKLHYRGRPALHPDWKLRDLGVAAFVQKRGSGEVLQALAVPSCGPKG